jgi:hypothetical protein
VRPPIVADMQHGQEFRGHQSHSADYRLRRTSGLPVRAAPRPPPPHSIPRGTTRIVTCPWHANRFDVTTGQVVTGVQSVRAYPVEVQGQDVLVDVPDSISTTDAEPGQSR